MHQGTIPREELKTLYNSGLSMVEIASKLSCSPHKIVYWMNKYGLRRRGLSDAMYKKLNPNGDPFKIKTSMNQDEKFLYGLGLGIYWGEGDKKSKNALRVANTDVELIKLFTKFLLNICQLEKHKLIYNLICFNDSDPKEVRNYWAKELRISKEKFGKIVQIPSQGKGTYKRKSKYGVCIIIVGNMKLKSWIMDEINKLSSAWIV